MYSKRIQNTFKAKKLKIGDRIIIKRSKSVFEGLLIPHAAGSEDVIVIKLDSGYNIGIELKKGMTVNKSKRKEPKAIQEEFERETGHHKHRSIKFNPNKPPISIIATGGTVTSKVDYKTGGVTSLMDADELLGDIPELVKIANIRRIESPFTRMSESFNYKDWQDLANLTAKLLNAGDKGVIITHGTDTLHYTSAALSFMLPNLTKPVILTGSQRSSDRGSSDSKMNLICAANIAISDLSGVGICMHATPSDNYCHFLRGTKVRKLHTSRRDAFQPVNDSPIAKVWPDGKTETLSSTEKREDKNVKADTKFEPNISLLKFYPGSDLGMIDYLVKKGVKGIVIEATGMGHVSVEKWVRNKKDAWLPKIKSAIDSGIPVCFAAQTIFGRLDPFVYSEAREAHDAGVIYLEDMLPETAFVKLGWVLGHTKKQDKIKEMMLKNFAGEISPRTQLDEFLKPSKLKDLKSE